LIPLASRVYRSQDQGLQEASQQETKQSKQVRLMANCQLVRSLFGDVAIPYLDMLVLLKSGTEPRAPRLRAILRAVQKVAKAMAMVFGGEGVQLIQVTFLGSQTSYYFKAPPRVFEISPTGLFLFFICYIKKNPYIAIT
jgi:hypothetical protein